MRAFAAGVFALLLGCDGAFAPKPFCRAQTCADLHSNCGPIADDGCGHPLDCGDCPSGQSCGRLLPNVCDLTPDGWMGGGTAAGGGSASGGGGVLGGGSGTAGGGTAGPGGGSSGGAGGAPAPPILALAGVTSERVDLAWSPSGAPMTDYQLRRAVNNGVFQPVPLGADTHFADHGVMPGTQMAYQVQAVSPSGGPGPLSNTVNVAIPFAVNAWRTEGGDIQHSGANLIETARAPGVLAWEHVFDGGAVSGVAIDPPNAFVTVVTAAESSLVSLDGNGGTRWVQPLGPVGFVSHPSVFNGKVSINYSNLMQGEVDVFDETGIKLWSSTSLSFGQGPKPAPISTGDALIANVGAGGMVLRMFESSGAIGGVATLTPADAWAPTLSDGQLWFSNGPMVSSANLLTLAVNGGFPQGPPMPMTADEWVVANNGIAVVADGAMLFTNGGPTQSGMKPYVAPPAIVPATMGISAIFAVSGDQIEMRQLPLGNLLVTFHTDGGLSYPPAFAAGVVYASSPTTVFAIDAQSGATLWTTTPGGRLSIAQGMLYVSGGSTVRAYALTP
ncbi:MAG: PQQ-binding-like beta-propeller repeat protein [Myxococcaceae bacterium]